MKIRKESVTGQAVIFTACLFIASCADVPASKTIPAPEMILLPGGTLGNGFRVARSAK